MYINNVYIYSSINKLFNRYYSLEVRSALSFQTTRSNFELLDHFELLDYFKLLDRCSNYSITSNYPIIVRVVQYYRVKDSTRLEVVESSF